MSDKTCVSCKTKKPEGDFRRRMKICKVCEEDPANSRVCPRCNDTYLSSKFQANICTYCKKGSWRVCGGCKQNLTFAHYRRGQLLCIKCEEGGVVCDKICNRCNQTKPSSSFRTNRKECLDCEQSFGRDYRKTTTKAREWANNNRERMAELQKNHYEANKVAIRKKEQERKVEDPIFKSIKDYRCEVCHLVKRHQQNSKKLITNHRNFTRWLKSLFYDEEMNMENYNTVWNVDHVLPLDLLFKKPINKWCWSLLEDYDLESILFSWYNTQPLLKEDNRKKGSTVTVENLKTHLATLGQYMTNYAIEKDDMYKTYRKVIRTVILAF